MIKVDYIYQMDLRLREIKQNQQQFGGCCVLMFGDPMQLRPVLGRFAWELPGGAQFQMAHQLQSIWSTFIHSLKITFSNWQIILARQFKLIGDIGWWQTMEKRFGPHLYIILKST